MYSLFSLKFGGKKKDQTAEGTTQVHVYYGYMHNYTYVELPSKVCIIYTVSRFWEVVFP